MRISYSSLETYIQCPQKFKFQQIDRIKTPKSKQTVFGTIIHSTLKFLHSNRTVIPSFEQIQEHYKNIWNENIFSDPEEQEIYFEQGQALLKNYYEGNNFSALHIVDLETRFEVPFENHTLTGIIDRIDKIGEYQYEIIDYKTSKSLPSQEEVDKNLQLSLYRLGITNRWPNLKLDQVTLSLYFLKHGIKLSTSRTKDDLEATKVKISNVVSSIETKRFEPIPSKLCDYCGYRNICPIWRHKVMQQEIGIENEEKLRETMKEFFELKNKIQQESQRLEELKALINEYCDQNKIERVFGENGYITRTLQKRYTYDTNKVKNILQPLGKWEEVLRVDDTKLKKTLSMLPSLVQEQINGAKIIDKEFFSLTISKNKKSG